MIDKKCFTADAISEIERILKKGNTVELKWIHDELVVVEIQRRVTMKVSSTGKT